MEVADTVRKATQDDLPQLSAALSKAFLDDPLMAWAIPDQDRRQRLLPEFFALFTRAFLRHHQTYTTAGDVVAAALWAPPGAVPVSGQDAQELGERIVELAGPDAPWDLSVAGRADQAEVLPIGGGGSTGTRAARRLPRSL
jgi:hypothetical protein